MALTDAKIRAAKPTDKAYKLTDGAGMFLLVHPNGSRYWRLRYRILGKEKTLALGVYPEVSLSEARTKRDEARKLISEGIDPCEQKRAKKVVPDLQLSFEHIARRWHASNKQWAQSHSDKVLKSLETHVFPFIGNRDITTLSTPDLLIPVRAAEAKQIYEIASRLQQRISAVMRYAVQSGIIRYNPALDMAGALTTVKRQHRPALDLSRLPELLSRIDGYKGQPVTRLAVMLNLLVFIRSSELRYARWSEIDIDNAMWTIPAEREPLPGVKFSHRGSKMRTPHLVPLSKQAVPVICYVLMRGRTRFCGLSAWACQKRSVVWLSHLPDVMASVSFIWMPTLNACRVYPLSTGNQKQHEIINHGNSAGYSDCVAAGQYRLRIGNYL